MSNKQAKRNLTPDEIQECARLKMAWEEFKAKEKEAGRRWSQESFGEHMGFTQGNFGHYLNARQAINLQFLLEICEEFRIEPSDISPRLAKLLPAAPTQNEFMEMLQDLPNASVQLGLDFWKLQLENSKAAMPPDKWASYMRMIEKISKREKR